MIFPLIFGRFSLSPLTVLFSLSYLAECNEAEALRTLVR